MSENKQRTATDMTGIRTLTGRIRADRTGRVIVERTESGHRTTVQVDEGMAIRVDFALEGSPDVACIDLHHDETGWRWSCRGRAVRVDYADFGPEAVHIEYSPASGYRALDVRVLEPYEGGFAIRNARDMLARCGKILEAIGESGGRPAEALLADLRRHAYYT